MRAVKAKLKDVSEQLKLPDDFVLIDQVMFHSAVMIAGKTETTISKVRLPTLHQMGWDPTGTFIRILYTDTKGRPHAMQLHGSTAKQTTLV
ncbi:MAG: hypothetical protein IPL34_20165 [Thiofilum sp.]|uniref:hypothetical protein n=1 Tax=Thiofilum sp. TaxID=2212733 RepID=UPI0025EF47C6|nr:hypothetical protein [Thiofilum sp.]MBK8455597.1 hypothetical protein [Thiofilum sp.]